MKMDIDDDVESFEMQKVTPSENKENKGMVVTVKMDQSAQQFAESK